MERGFNKKREHPNAPYPVTSGSKVITYHGISSGGLAGLAENFRHQAA